MTNLYAISNLTSTGSTFTAEITFDPSHPVFEGHFPGQPVVPGVVLVDVSAAVVSLLTGKELIVKEASVIKFLKLIDPTVNPVIFLDGTAVEEDSNCYKASLRFYSVEVDFAKLKGIWLVKY